MEDVGDQPEAGPGARLQLHLTQKVAVLLGLAVGICVPYFSLQYVDWFPAHTVPALGIDDAIPFSPNWVWVYLSIAVLVPAAPLMIPTRAGLAHYSRGLAVMCTIAFVCFLLFPVAGPRPASVPEHAMYQWLVGVDRPLNSMPSLHAALVVYSTLCLAQHGWAGLRGISRRIVAASAIGWAGAILFATLATKQHWFLDLPAGALIAVVADRLAHLHEAFETSGPGSESPGP